MGYKIDEEYGERTHVRLKNEISGAFGDFGTFLPYVLGVITVAGLKPGGIFTLFGLFYLATGLFYQLPIAVQPMKIVSAAILAGKATPGEVAGATLVIGGALIFLSVTGLVGVLARIIPRPVTVGIQLGLGCGLAFLGLKMVSGNLLIGLITMAVMLPLGFNRRFPLALTGIGVGVFLGAVQGPFPAWPGLVPSWQLPEISWPAWPEVWGGMTKVALPQLALTVTNAVIVTASLAGQLFPENRRVTPGNLALTQGVANLAAGALGGFAMCHGAGGLAAHYRFGARTALAPIMLGVALMITGLGYGESGVALLRFIPAATLGALLFYGAIELALAGWAPTSGWGYFITFVVAALTFCSSPALAILIGLVLAWVGQSGVFAEKDLHATTYWDE